ncbi:MAG TPA: hypothetical protein VFI02_21790 [Armatimonadota bacterium]|nr:hypothetical protein [Armatimonadota bacterium]
MTKMMNGRSAVHGRAVVGWLIFFVIIILAFGAMWGWKSIECGRQIRDRTTELAQDTAHAISVFGSKQIIAGNWGDLQSFAEDLVKEKPLAYVAIVNAKGVAVVHTNASLRDQPFAEPKNTRSMVNASVPVMNLTKQAATVWVGANIGP